MVSGLERQARLAASDQALWFGLVARPLSSLYRVVTNLRAAAFDSGQIASEKLPGRVISVGNIAAGGTGKSPVVMMIAAALRTRGAKPAILTRGYGSSLRKGDSLALKDGKLVMAVERTGADVRLPDEARMQSVELPGVPVIAGPARHAAAMRFLEAHPEDRPTHWILDDGFQHRQIARDVDIVLLDARRPWGNGSMLPAGILREAPDALRRADVVMFTRAEPEWAPSPADMHQARKLAPKALILSAPFVGGDPQPPKAGGDAFSVARHSPLLLACGIADPESLQLGLEARGFSLAGVYAVEDHAQIAPEVLGRRAESAASVVTTAKDYWRDPRVFADLPIPVFVLPLTVALPRSDLDAFFERLAR